MCFKTTFFFHIHFLLHSHLPNSILTLLHFSFILSSFVFLNHVFLSYSLEVLKLYGDQLTNFEKREIEAYPEIWYLGLEAKKIHGEEGAQLNGGYDDENGSYNKVIG